MSEHSRTAARAQSHPQKSAKGSGAERRESSIAAFAAAPEALQAMWGQGRGWAAWLKSSEAMFKGAATVQGELLAFVDKRLRHDIETGRSLMECNGNWSEAVRIQNDYFMAATEDYFKETQRIMDLAAKSTRDAFSSATAASKEAEAA